MNDVEAVVAEFERLMARPADEPIPGFQIPEGLARITRNGHTDIYVVFNREPLALTKFSIAYALDDFEPDKRVGYTLFVEETDHVEHLGGIKEYFTPRGPADAFMLYLWRQFDRKVGYLPVVRACEKLRTLGRMPTVEEIYQAANEVSADYHTRRLLLTVTDRG